jgi:hypothetical protein
VVPALRRLVIFCMPALAALASLVLAAVRASFFGLLLVLGLLLRRLSFSCGDCCLFGFGCGLP